MQKGKQTPHPEPKNPYSLKGLLGQWGNSICSFLLLILGYLGETWFPFLVSGINIWLLAYLLAYLIVGLPVLYKGWNSILKGEVFTEFFLMGLATLGAIAIGEFPEAVAVMLFYTIGELLQHQAVNKARGNIKSLLDLRPDMANVIRGDKIISMDPEEVSVGEILEIKAGERVPLDGVLLGQSGNFNTSALTGESIPQNKKVGEEVLAGMVNLENFNTIQVTKEFNDSSLAKIIRTLKGASSRKAKTEQFIRKFAKIYTPIVTFLAIGLVAIPYLIVDDYQFNDWLYRSLVFLVISCPCALVISIPLGYFGGIGAASRNGILFKGSDFLDKITKINTIIFDKTGTLTQSLFEVQEVKENPNGAKDWMSLAASLEQKTNHPIAKALVKFVIEKKIPLLETVELKEVPGKGIAGIIAGKEVLVGNKLLLQENRITIPIEEGPDAATLIYVAVEGKYCGQFVIDDQIKPDAKDTITALRKSGIREIFIFSGDKQEVTDQVGKTIGVDRAYGGLLPEQKVRLWDDLKTDESRVTAFVGDGINDAPVLALADIGIAMGAMGSDLAINSADVVIQTDQLSKIIQAMEIGKATKSIVWQNIGMAFGVKFLVLSLGAAGMAGMWEAVFADVGVALLAILNAIRINKIFK
ncbi:MAG: heavy metal translocating P-type ATPase [Cyclobacteriaceae bacterium]